MTDRGGKSYVLEGANATAEVRESVQAVQVKLFCENCGEEMRLMRAFHTSPMRYEYACENCGITDVSERLYPYIAYEAIPCTK